jgi:uncharacterized membrane protein
MLGLAFLIGVDAGLRSLTAPAIVAWAAHRRRLTLQDTPLALMGSAAVVAILTVLAAAELVADKLPGTPSRTEPVGLGARVALGALSGACLTASGSESITLGAACGAAGGVAGAFAGHDIRAQLVRSLEVPDWPVASFEDAVAIAAGVLIVSRTDVVN